MRFRTATIKLPSSGGSDNDAKKILPKKEFKQDKFSKYFQGKGLTVNDLPKAIICHELMGVFMLALTWSTCYFFPPSQNRFLKEPIAKMISMVPKVLSGPVTSNPFLSSRLGSSYLESSCLRKLIRPITLPSKLYLTYRLVKVLPKFERFQQKALDAPVPDENIKVIGLSQKGSSNAMTIRGGYFDDISSFVDGVDHSFRSYAGDCATGEFQHYCEVGDEFRSMLAGAEDSYNGMKLNYRNIGRVLC